MSYDKVNNQQYQKGFEKSLIPCILLSLGYGCVFCYVIPLTAYFQNVNEFTFAPNSIIKAMLPYFATVFTGVMVLQIVVDRFLPHESVRVFGREIRISSFHVLLLGLLTCLIFEGSVISYQLPELDFQEGSMFGSIPRIIASTAGWIVGVCLAVWKWRPLGRRFFFFSGAIFVFFVAMLLDAMRNSDEKAEIKFSSNDVLGNMTFHARNNIILIMADGLPTYAVEYVLNRQPELKEKLKGFTLFLNNLGPGKPTVWAVPAILQGQVYSGEVDHDFYNAVFLSPKSLPNRFYAKGYDIFMTSVLPRYTAMFTENKSLSIETTSIARMDAVTYLKLCLRFIPYGLKRRIGNHIWSSINSSKPVYDKSGVFDIEGFDEFRGITARIDNKTQRPTVHWHHYLGAHSPYIYDRDGKRNPEDLFYKVEGLIGTTEFVLKNFIALLDELQSRNMYDAATIVLHADHGDHQPVGLASLSTFNTPALMIKPPYESGVFTVSTAPTSSVDMVDIVDGLVSGDPLSKMLPKEPRERRFLEHDSFVYAITETDVKKAIKRKLDLSFVTQPTQLQFGKTYTFLAKDKLDNLAVPITDSGFVNTYGDGLDCWIVGEPIKLGFLTPPEAKRIALRFKIQRDPVFTSPERIAVKDLNSGKMIFDFIDLSDQTAPELILENMLVVDGAVRFEIKVLDPEAKLLKFTSVVVGNEEVQRKN